MAKIKAVRIYVKDTTGKLVPFYGYPDPKITERLHQIDQEAIGAASAGASHEEYTCIMSQAPGLRRAGIAYILAHPADKEGANNA